MSNSQLPLPPEKPNLDIKRNPRCGGRSVNGNPDANCYEGPDGQWFCFCGGRSIKVNYELAKKLVEAIISKECYKGANKGDKLKALCLWMSVHHPTFSRYKLICHLNLRKQFLKWLADAKAKNGFDEDYFEI